MKPFTSRTPTWTRRLRTLPLLLAFALAGCNGDVGVGIGFGWHAGPDHWPDHPDWPSWPDRPQGASGLFPIAGDICGVCSVSRDGTGSQARFDGPQGIAADGAGNLYVAEPASATIRKITPQGAVTTLAGTAGVPGYADGSGGAARFNAPSRLETDANGNLVVTDTGNSAIRSITPLGAVVTLAGNGGCGSGDGSGAQATFCNPKGIALDRWGNLWVADSGNTRCAASSATAGSARWPGRRACAAVPTATAAARPVMAAHASAIRRTWPWMTGAMCTWRTPAIRRCA
ncbi:MAG: hypothetical protein EOO78_07270 [Oxalobacteraceae bacterium]|nr:MAG: hypothetical protein EOO78_07270 [Oxalobacteraceae bacterium]